MTAAAPAASAADAPPVTEPAPAPTPKAAPKAGTQNQEVRLAGEQLDPRQHRQSRCADQFGRRTRDHPVHAQPLLRRLRLHPSGKSARRPVTARAQHARAARKRHGYPHVADQLRVQSLSAAGSRYRNALGKNVDLQVSGETTELDKTVLEKIGDPLVHLVRNSLDHGLEKPEQRIAAGQTGNGRLAAERLPRGRQYRYRSQ